MTAIFSSFVEALAGKVVSHIWRGYGSTLFVEFGDLSPGKMRKGREGNPIGELSLMMDFWRIENPRSVLVGARSPERTWPKVFERLLGAKVTDMEFIGHLPEICISLDDGRRIVSFSPVEGQPDWTVMTRKPVLGSLCVKRGILSVDSCSS